MRELKPTCCKKVGTWLTNTCGRPSKVVHEGKHYCGIHNPIAIAEKYAVKTAAWHAEWAARDASRDAAKAKQLEIERRAACYPELLEALKESHKAIDWLMARLIQLDPLFMPTKSPIWNSVVNNSEIIAKAEGAPA
jgi:hypothetical protein